MEGAKGRAAESIAERLARHRSPGEAHVQRRADGRWIQISERKTAEGGTDAVYTDISGIKNAEEEIREATSKAELANALLKQPSQSGAGGPIDEAVKISVAPSHSSIFTGQREVEIASSSQEVDGVLFRHR